jgi:predicted nucleic acid-binding protein
MKPYLLDTNILLFYFRQDYKWNYINSQNLTIEIIQCLYLLYQANRPSSLLKEMAHASLPNRHFRRCKGGTPTPHLPKM